MLRKRMNVKQTIDIRVLQNENSVNVTWNIMFFFVLINCNYVQYWQILLLERALTLPL